MFCDTILRGPQPKSHTEIIGRSLGHIIFEYLRKRKDKVALVDGITDETLTFTDILNKTLQLANSLKKHGIKRNDVVGIMSENNMEYCLPVLACLCLGAPITFINPSYTPSELSNCLKISQPKMIFTSPLAARNVTAAQKDFDFLQDVVLLNGEYDGLQKMESFTKNGTTAAENFKFEPVDPKTQDAFILYTSGTTGLPKGALLTQENFVTQLLAFGDVQFGSMDENTVTLGLLPFFHIFGLLLLISSMIFGGKMVILKAFKPNTFLNAIQKYRANRLYVVPPILLFMVKSDLVEEYNVSCIKDIVCGGSPLREEVHKAAEIKFNCEVRQAYGLTELCGCITLSPLNSRLPGNSGKLTPLAECRVYDTKSGKYVRANEPGELCFRTPSCMKGYVRNKEATEDIFDEAGFLHTGDVGYYDEKGFIFVVDRIKELIKYKGFQVSPAQLEAILLTHEAVAEAAVVGLPDERAGELPLAFIVKKPDMEVSAQELIDLVAGEVAVHNHLSGGVRFIESLPRTPVGKIERKQLRQIAKGIHNGK